MNASTRRVVERKEAHVAVGGRKPCRPRPVGKNSAAVAPEDGSSVFERHFWLFACGWMIDENPFGGACSTLHRRQQ